MITALDFSKILFLDIETVPCWEYYEQMESHVKKLWDKKAGVWKEKDVQVAHLSCEDLFYKRGGVYAEFGKIVAIGLGMLYTKNGVVKLRVKCISHTSEKVVLTRFMQILLKLEYGLAKKKTGADKDLGALLCAHNGKEFDFPYIARRMLINSMCLPEALKLHGKKPWDIHHLDTMDLWRFGDYKTYTSLDLLAATFGVESSKTQMDGSQVCEVYYKEKNLEKIARYCSQDVITLAQVLLKMSGLATVRPENIEYVELAVPAYL
jgi:hypothetical protein